MFGKSLKRELGKNTGKWVSNKVFGDGHSTPHRVKVTRDSGTSKPKAKPATVQKAEIEARMKERELNEQRRMAELQADSMKSDEVRIREIEAKEKQEEEERKHKKLKLYAIVAGVAIILLWYGFNKITAPPCENVQGCIAINEFGIAKSFLSEISYSHSEAINIVEAQVAFLADKGEYKEAYNAIAFLKGYDFTMIYEDEKQPAIDQCISTLVENAILNDDLTAAKKYQKFHSNPNELNKLY